MLILMPRERKYRVILVATNFFVTPIIEIPREVTAQMVSRGQTPVCCLLVVEKWSWGSSHTLQVFDDRIVGCLKGLSPDIFRGVFYLHT